MAEKNFLFNGNLNFVINERDLSLEDYNPDSAHQTIAEGIEMAKAKLASVNKADSADLYLKLYQLYQAAGNMDEATKQVMRSHELMLEMLQDTPVSADIVKQAGFFTMQTNPDQSQAFPYFAEAWRMNPKDSTSLLLMITIYFNYGLYQESDSLINIAHREFPGSFGPLMIQTQIESMNLYLKYLNDPQSVMSKCLHEVADLGKINDLRKSGSSERNTVLSYMLEELILIMKYQLNMSGDTLIPLLPCDRKALTEMRKIYHSIHDGVNLVPDFTTSHALGWTYALEQKFDSAIYFLNRAANEVRPLGGSYLSNRVNISNSLMAMTYLSGDTTGAIQQMKNMIAAHDTTGISGNDYLMLATLQLKARQYEASTASAVKALDFYADKSASLRIQSLCAFYSGKKTEAFNYLNQAVSVGKTEFNNYMLSGLVYLMDNNHKEAFRYLEAAWYIDAQDPDLINILNIYFKSK